MAPLDRIVLDPAVRFGKPCVRGTRITVGDVVGCLAGGMTIDQVLGDFPRLTPPQTKRYQRVPDDAAGCVSPA